MEISPNGIPGLIVEKNDNITSDEGGTASFQISLKTHRLLRNMDMALSQRYGKYFHGNHSGLLST